MRPTLYVMVGISGSGKSTWAREHIRGLVINADLLRRMLMGDWYQRSWEHVLWQAEENLIETVCKQAAILGVDVIVDETNLTRERRRRYIELAASVGMKTVAVFLNTPLEVARGRNQARKERVSDLVIAKMHSVVEPPTADEGFQETLMVNC